MTAATSDITGLKANAEAVIFDFDGTLADSMWVWEHVDREFFDRHQLPYDQEYAEMIAVLGFESGADYTIQKYDVGATREEIIEEWKSIAQHEYATKVRLKPRAEEYLHKLHEAGVPLGIATSLQRNLLEPALKNNGVFSLFSAISVCDEIVDTGKSTPAVYHAAASELGVQLENCIVFEDVVTAAGSAKRGGAYVVGVYDEHKQQATDELRALVDEFIEGYDQLL